MATPATGGPGRAHRVARTVDAAGVILPLLLMTARTVWRRQFAGVNEVLDAFVAIDAIQPGVQRLVEAVRREDQREDFIAHLARRGGIKMAIEAISVGELLRGETRLAQPANQRQGKK